MSRRGSLLLAIAVIGLVSRAVVCFAVLPAWQDAAGVGGFPDAYPELATSLIETGTLGFGELGATPTTLRGPGFPLWLAVGILLAGSSASWLGFWTSLWGVGAGVAVAAMLARRHGTLVAAIGGLVSVLHPLPAIIAARTMSDEFHAALGWIALSLIVLAAWDRSERRPGLLAALGAAAMALHLLTRSSGLLTLLAVVIVALFARPRRPRLLVTILALALLPALLWSVRSSMLERRPVFVQSLIGYNFWLGEGFHRYGNESVSGEHYVERMRLILDHAGMEDANAETFYWIRLTPAESAASEEALRAAALQHVSDRPGDYAWRFVSGIVGFWSEAATSRRTAQYRIAVLPIVALALVAAIGLRRQRPPPDLLAWLALTSIVLHNVAYAAIVAMARNGVQVWPAVSYLVGLSVPLLLATVGRWRSPPP